mgnify:CR=1 FL=1
MRDLADFENMLKKKTDRELSEFVARQIYDICERVDALEKRDKMTVGKAGSIGGAIVAVIGGIILFVLEGLKR